MITNNTTMITAHIIGKGTEAAINFKRGRTNIGLAKLSAVAGWIGITRDNEKVRFKKETKKA